MRALEPRHRYLEVRNAWRTKVSLSPLLQNDVYATEYLKLLTNDPTAPASETVQHAADLFSDERHRGILDAFLLAGATLKEAASALDVPEAVVDVYQYLFFDTTVFRNKLERMSYSSSYEGDPWASEYVRSGVVVGVSYLMWSFGGGNDVSTRDAVRNAMTDAFFKSRAHRGNTLTSGVSKEAHKWLSTATKNAELLEKLDPQTQQQAHEALRIALESKDETIPVEQSPVPTTDILH